MPSAQRRRPPSAWISKVAGEMKGRVEICKIREIREISPGVTPDVETVLIERICCLMFFVMPRAWWWVTTARTGEGESGDC
jgi:hypothetical protein